MDFAQTALIVVIALVLGWFAVGVVYNIRRGNAVLKWLQGGLPKLGERTTLRWLGSSAVVLEIAKPRAPFRRVELMLVLEPRDVPWFWLLARSRGRRDVLILRGQLVSAPAQEFAWFAPGSWSERERSRNDPGRGWPAEPMDGLRLQVPPGMQAGNRQAAEAGLAAARLLNENVWQLSARRGLPHLELHLPLPDPRQAEAAAYCEQIRRLAETVGRARTRPA
jgi:hypothetical protein